MKKNTVLSKQKKSFKYCVVPKCKNTVIKAPNKTYFMFPKSSDERSQWCAAIGKHVDFSKIRYVCEDHFDMNADTEYSDDGRCELRITPGVVPHKFPCQKDTTKNLGPAVNGNSPKNTDDIPPAADEADVEESAPASMCERDGLVCRVCGRGCTVARPLTSLWQSALSDTLVTIAHDLHQLTGVKVEPEDGGSTVICVWCCGRVQDAGGLVRDARHSQRMLRRSGHIAPRHTWPQPIQVEKIAFPLDMQVEVKQEPDWEQEAVENQFEAITKDHLEVPDQSETITGDLEVINYDIKVEPEEIVQSEGYCEEPISPLREIAPSSDPIQTDVVKVEEDISHTESLAGHLVEAFSERVQLRDERIQSSAHLENMRGKHPSPKIIDVGRRLNSRLRYSEVEYLECYKEEPGMEEADLSLCCQLCGRTHRTLSGLRTHVIVSHTYKNVRRKNTTSGRQKNKYHCHICRRVFNTQTDLLVHEACHDQLSCYTCGDKFNTFPDLYGHKQSCAPIPDSTHNTRLTLDDVIRKVIKPSSPRQNTNEHSKRENKISSTTVGRDSTITENDKENKLKDPVSSLRTPSNRYQPNSPETPKSLFNCPLCNAEFSDSYYVKIHLEVNHRDGLNGLIESGDFVTSSGLDLNLHIQNNIGAETTKESLESMLEA